MNWLFVKFTLLGCRNKERRSYYAEIAKKYSDKTVVLKTKQQIEEFMSRSEMFEYMTAQEAAEKWNVSLRWVQRLCKGNRIEGVMNINRVWLIPKNAEKPADARKKLMKN